MYRLADCDCIISLQVRQRQFSTLPIQTYGYIGGIAFCKKKEFNGNRLASIQTTICFAPLCDVYTGGDDVGLSAVVHIRRSYCPSDS